ncbi:hypothetical protein VTJ04DRAFT_9569 [Mycothermus thermophilus]|uniref:uncharacterized protein n=1 Tax=Humicola insolens TaxID=85995 RepID=UPI003744426B
MATTPPSETKQKMPAMTDETTDQAHPAIESLRFECFLALPPELRVMIYMCVLWVGFITVTYPLRSCDPVFFPRNTRGLFLANQIISTEARHLLYAVNKFSFLEYTWSNTEDSASRMVKWLRKIGLNANSVRQIWCLLNWMTKPWELESTPENLAMVYKLAPNLQILTMHCSHLQWPPNQVQVEVVERLCRDIRRWRGCRLETLRPTTWHVIYRLLTDTTNDDGC